MPVGVPRYLAARSRALCASQFQCSAESVSSFASFTFVTQRGNTRGRVEKIQKVLPEN
jgi:hypothetical protein